MTRSALLALALVACGRAPSAACEDYTRAALDCSAQALGAPEAPSDEEVEALCADWDDLDGEARGQATDRFDCASQAFDGADCATAAGYGAAATEAEACLYE